MDAHGHEVAAGSAASQPTSAESTRAVLEHIERHLPGAAVFLAHLDRGQDLHRIVDVRGGSSFGLHADQPIALGDSLCAHMVGDLAPRRCNDVASHPLYAPLAFARATRATAYLGVPVELSNGARIGSLAAVGHRGTRFTAEDEDLLGMLARVVGSELERESSQRDALRMHTSLRIQARGMAALERLSQALVARGDPRPVVCASACTAAGAPIAFLLEPAGRDYVSTAMAGVEMAPVTIQSREQEPHSGRGFMRTESYFVPDARAHPALAAPLVAATGARSALFEPVLRNDVVVGVLIVIWREAVEQVDDATAGVLKLVAAQAALAIERAGVATRAAALALSDPLTGLSSRRTFERELPRELARARRGETPVCVAAIDIDGIGEVGADRDRLIKEAAAAWSSALRDVDLVARLDGAGFTILLPSCGLSEACDVLDRLRERTPRHKTASAGVARWDGDEPSELLLLRSRDALTAAQRAGRDMTVAAD